MNAQFRMPVPPGSQPVKLEPPAGRRRWQDEVPTSFSHAAWAGLFAILVFLAVIGVWSATAPISGAVVATGIVQANGSNQVIDHLEGGIIASIEIEEGEAVKAGQVLVMLDATRVQAERNRVISALLSIEAQIVRAEAERDGARSIAFDALLQGRARMADSFESLDEQIAEFRNRLQRHESELAAVDQRILAAREEIEGIAIQKESEERKLELLRDEIADKQGLLKKGLIQRSQVQALQRAEADSLGRVGALAASIGQRRSMIAELGEQRAGLEATRREAAAAQINDLRSRAADLREQLRAREDILLRSEIRAPADGVVVRLSKNTVGSVVRAGEAIAELLPTARDLQIQVKIMPHDVDSVKVGQPAIVRMTALNARTTPDVPAKVAFRSADRLIDELREPFYAVRLEIDGGLPPGMNVSQIHAGMPVEALIQTGDRTFLEYLVRPIQDSFAKAFREE